MCKASYDVALCIFHIEEDRASVRMVTIHLTTSTPVQELVVKDFTRIELSLPLETIGNDLVGRYGMREVKHERLAIVVRRTPGKANVLDDINV